MGVFGSRHGEWRGDPGPQGPNYEGHLLSPMIFTSVMEKWRTAEIFYSEKWHDPTCILERP